eukprot:79657-Prorocentrum_minimum.AAC.3
MSQTRVLHPPRYRRNIHHVTAHEGEWWLVAQASAEEGLGLPSIITPSVRQRVQAGGEAGGLADAARMFDDEDNDVASETAALLEDYSEGDPEQAELLKRAQDVLSRI